MEKIALVDLWTVCDKNNNPIGHGIKVGNEYYEYVKNNIYVLQYANKSILNFLNSTNKRELKYSLTGNEFKIKKIIKTFKSFTEVYNNNNNIWFYVPDIYVFIYILMLPKKRHKYIVNIYEEYANNKIKNWIYKKALKKIDLSFVTNKKLLSHMHTGILIPDYAYIKDKYEQYNYSFKEERVICIGTMNEKKQLREAVEVFGKINMPLYIVGQFANEELYNDLNKIKKENIIIENKYVCENEYYNLLASSRYCLLPYDSKFYKNRTSGVLQECLFMNTIPICPKEILEFCNVNGIGYDDINKLSLKDFNIDIESIYSQYNKEKEEFYKADAVKTIINNGINSI